MCIRDSYYIVTIFFLCTFASRTSSICCLVPHASSLQSKVIRFDMMRCGKRTNSKNIFPIHPTRVISPVRGQNVNAEQYIYFFFIFFALLVVSSRRFRNVWTPNWPLAGHNLKFFFLTDRQRWYDRSRRRWLAETARAAKRYKTVSYTHLDVYKRQV